MVKHYYNNCHPCEAVRYPVCYINLTLPGSNVDVNIDPNKTTVLLHSMVSFILSLVNITPVANKEKIQQCAVVYL